MGRWEPGAAGRLREAAMALYAERGYDRTTVAEIADRAGVTARTFFRHFADKREVLFYGSDSLRGLIVGVIADAPATATAMDAVNRALQAVAAMVQENPEPARLRNKIMSANPELREREFVKLAGIAAAMSVALRDRGVPEPAASLLGETGVAIYRIAFARWVGEPGQPDLAAILRECTAELKSALGDRLPSPA